MANYSRQLDKFIDSKLYAHSSFRQCDNRTWVSYYQDESGLIHSNSFNYSIIGSRPVTVEEFNKCVIKDSETKVFFCINVK
jgi:hypothetical protein